MHVCNLGSLCSLGSLGVLLPCVRTGAFVRASLVLTLMWTVGSHFIFYFFYFVLFYFFVLFILSFSFHFSFFFLLSAVLVPKKLIARNQELDFTLPVPTVR